VLQVKLQVSLKESFPSEQFVAPLLKLVSAGQKTIKANIVAIYSFQYSSMLNKNSQGVLKKVQPSKVESKVLLSSRKSKGSACG